MCINKINIFNYPVLFMYTIFIIQTFNHWKDQIGGFEGVKLGMGFVWRTISSTKARVPQSSWADVDVELWLLYVSAPDSPFLTEWDKNEHRDFSSEKRASVLAGAITKGVVLMGIIAGSFTNAPSATETTHSRLVVNHNSLSCNFQLYTLGHLPICVNEPWGEKIAEKLSI